MPLGIVHSQNQNLTIITSKHSLNPTASTLAKTIAAVSSDKANVSADKIKVKNYQYLLKQKVIRANYNDYQVAKQRLGDDSVQLAYDQEELSLLQKGEAKIGNHLVQSVIKSPVTGYVLQRNVDIGDSVISLGDSQTATTLFSIANMNDLIFKGSVDQSDANKIHPGMKATITIGALPNEKISGKLLQIGLQSNQQNQQNDSATTQANNSSNTSPFTIGFQVKIGNLSIPKKIKLLPGYSATANIVTKQAKSTLLLPESFIIFKNNKTYVHLASAAKKLHEIKTGISNGLTIQIIKGLTLGEKIVQ